MSHKERRRLAVLEDVKDNKLTLVQAAVLLALGYRQAKRVWKRYQAQGDSGLVHRSRGRASSRRRPQAERARIVARCLERYPDFGPTLAAEHLRKEGHKVDHETLRRWLLAEGHWRVRRKRQKHRRWRERKECFGQMVQMDGSHHDWFEGRAPRAVLMVIIDDATNRTLARFYPQETTRACYDMIERWIRSHGVPASLYVDRDSIYRCERLPTVAEQIAGREPRTQFGRAMEQLGVELILANSPQAKGRVERRNALFQDRLVKEMRLEGISDMAAANEFLSRVFLPALNRKFTVAPKAAADAHQKLSASLLEVLSWEEERTVGNDWTVVWKNRWFQIERQEEALNLAGKKITAREMRDGRVELLHGQRRLKMRALEGRPEPKKPAPARIGRVELVKPPATHPWRNDKVAAGQEFFRKKRAEGAWLKAARASCGCGLRYSLATLGFHFARSRMITTSKGDIFT
ncbi:MAG TPA: ISNCY family transposase [Methylomirabilota bacterium]|nr:ISNCY family transposase [Methylomirabilota bacterium]